MRIVFMGTPDFAVPSLKALVENGYDVVAAVTQPDKPKGRGNKLAPPEVKQFALEHGIPVFQPIKLRKNEEFLAELKELSPDLLVTCAYGNIIPQAVLDVPLYGCINVHGSLLPKYRGAAPIQWAIINGDKVTGVTTMMTDIGIDTGDILLKKEVEITDDINAGELFEVLSEVGAKLLIETIELHKLGKLTRTPQVHSEATHTSMLTKETGLIDWNKEANNIHNLVRGVYPWPVAYTLYNGERMRVLKTTVENAEDTFNEVGKIIDVNDKGIHVSAGKGIILIECLQFDGGKAMKVADYLRGHSIEKGIILGI